MAEATVIRRGMALHPADLAAEIEIEKLPLDKPVQARLWRPRSHPQHAMAFAFFTLLADALNHGGGHTVWTQDSVRRRLLVVTGHADLIPLPDKVAKQWGTRVAVCPRSMSFGAMDAAEFTQFLNDSLDYVRDHLAPWIEDAPQWGEIKTMVGALE